MGTALSDQAFQMLAIVIYFAAMLGIGFYAFRRTQNLDGYMLADRELKPWIAALSANAADMSGWLLMGLPGAVYLAGMCEAWIAIGLTIGAFINWMVVAPRLRNYSEIAENAITIPSFFAKRLKGDDRMGRVDAKILRITAALVILIFFTFYVSSGMVSAGKFVVASFGWPYLTGMAVVAAVTLAYTVFGGFLGATLTDVAQGLLMLCALIAVPVVAITQLGGWNATVASATDVLPDAFNLFSGLSDKGALAWGVATFSTAAWGLGYFGQPHIITRFMALRSAKEAKTARWISLFWMILTAAGAILTALVGIGYFAGNPEIKLEDPETVFLLLSRILFHPLVAGFVLAAVLAATMSTMSSQLVVCSSALVEDLYDLSGREVNPKAQLMISRGGVLVVAIIAAAMAINPSASILELVAFAWAGFGAAFGPIVLLSLYWRKLTAVGAAAGLVSATLTVFIWGNIDALSSAMYEIVPGFLINLLVCWLVSRATYHADPEVDAEFDQMLASLKSDAKDPVAA